MVFSRVIGRDAAAMLGALLLSACAGDLTSTPGGSDIPTSPAFAATTVVNARAAHIAVGEKIFNDQNLSRFGNQSCASCHSAAWGFNGPDDGSIESIDAAFFAGSFKQSVTGTPTRFGRRKPPAAAYAVFAPTLRWNKQEGTWVGGNFWDGRARGLNGNTPAVDQALGPFKADVEHAFSAVCVLWEISASPYAREFEQAVGIKFSSIPFAKIRNPDNSFATREQFCHSPNAADIPELPPGWTARDLTTALSAYRLVGVTIAAFEESPAVSRFASKFDDVAARRATVTFTADELAGQELFNGRGTCKICHSTDVGPELFTDFSYYNLGVPRHPKDPTHLDLGLGATIADAAFNGFFKSPSLRNVAKTPLGGGRRTYMHNGALSSLEEVVHFYNTRDLKRCPANVQWVRFPTNQDPVQATAQGVCWPAPDFPNTLVPEIGNIGLTAEEERLIVAYMRTFTDR